MMQVKIILIICLLAITNINASSSVAIGSLVWQDNDENKEMRKNWNDAKLYCSNLTLDSYEDWRLPHIKELQSLVDLNKYRPAIHDKIQHVSVLTHYWSMTPSVGKSGQAWQIFYKYGEAYYSNKTEKYGVRCVRNK